MKKSNQLGTRLRSLREHRSLTQSQLAERAGCGAPFISMLERGGRSDISYRLAARIAVALGEEPKDIAVAVVVESSIPEEPKDITIRVAKTSRGKRR
jgi:transcriptional regulator with XRE-family HTH domain